MSRTAGEPLELISIRVPQRDLEILRRTFSRGWQTKLKELIRAYTEQLENEKTKSRSHGN